MISCRIHFSSRKIIHVNMDNNRQTRCRSLTVSSHKQIDRLPISIHAMCAIVAFHKKKSLIKRKGGHKIRVDTYSARPSFRRRKMEAKLEREEEKLRKVGLSSRQKGRANSGRLDLDATNISWIRNDKVSSGPVQFGYGQELHPL